MNQRAAFIDTIKLAIQHEVPADGGKLGPDFGLDHLLDMLLRIGPDFSPSKLGRWLGWAQAVVVAHGSAILDDVKSINMRHAPERDEPIIDTVLRDAGAAFAAAIDREEPHAHPAGHGCNLPEFRGNVSPTALMDAIADFTRMIDGGIQPTPGERIAVSNLAARLGMAVIDHGVRTSPMMRPEPGKPYPVQVAP